MILMSHMMVLTSHMMIPTITLLGTLNFYLLFKFNIYKKCIILDSTNITYDGTYITFDGTLNYLLLLKQDFDYIDRD